MKKLIESFAIIFVLFFGLALFLLSNRIWGLRAFTVMSGSMEPVINTGTLVLTQRINPHTLSKNDVVTFIRPEKKREFVTHRIVDVAENKGLLEIKTKGDNNKSNDSWTLVGGEVVGKVVYSVPYLGYLLSFSKTKIGIALFILIPALIIIYMEITNIFHLLKTRKVKNPMVNEGQLLSLFLLVTLITLTNLQPTSALLSDTASLTGNKFTVVLNQPPSGCGGDSNIDVSNNGAGSNNTVNVTSNCTTTINQSNSTTINNTVNTTTNSGSNTIFGNTSSDSTTITGSTNTNVSVTTTSGSNSVVE